jgi:hypothetical protein
MKSKTMVLSSLLFSGVFVASAGSGWSQSKVPSSSDPNSKFASPQQLPSGDPAVRAPGAGNPEAGQNPNAGKKDDSLKSKSSSKTSTEGKSSLKSKTGTSGKSGTGTESGDPAAREPGTGNPEPGQNPSGGQRK